MRAGRDGIPGGTNSGYTDVGAGDLDTIEVGDESVVVIGMKYRVEDLRCIGNGECTARIGRYRGGDGRTIIPIAVADAAGTGIPGTVVEGRVAPVRIGWRGSVGAITPGIVLRTAVCQVAVISVFTGSAATSSRWSCGPSEYDGKTNFRKSSESSEIA